MLRTASETNTPSSLSTKYQHSELKKHKKIKKTSEKKCEKRKESKGRHRRKEKSYRRDLERKEPNNMHLLKWENNLNNEVKLQAAYGPVLPPNLKQNKVTLSQAIPVEARKPNNELFVGPITPLVLNKGNDLTTLAMNRIEKPENLVDYFGPLPFSENEKFNATQVQLEERALQLKIATINGCLPSCNINQTEREEWMIELPEVGIKRGFAALSSNNRRFYQGKNILDLSNRSCWTKTPNDIVAKQKTEDANKDQSQRNAQEIYDKHMDAEQRALTEEHIRGKSLLQIHHKKLRKELERRSKGIKTLNGKPTRRPFSRDVDLKLNKVDSNQTRSIIGKSKILNTKFTCGRKQYL